MVDRNLSPDDELQVLRKQVDDFLTDTEEARRMSERDRDYYDNFQWTAHEEAKLRSRNQAPIVVNRIKPKVEGLKGLLGIRNSDPKAYPRTQKHEETSHAVTDALRFVADNNEFNDNIKQNVAEDFFIEGYGGAIVDGVKKEKDKKKRRKKEKLPKPCPKCSTLTEAGKCHHSPQ